MHHDFIYDESAKTILIKLSKKGFWIDVLAMLVGMGGMGVALICIHSTIWELLGGIFIIIGYCIFVAIHIWEFYVDRIIMTAEGIWYRSIRQNKRFLWEDCKFIGKWIPGGRNSGTELVFCRQEVQRDPNGKIPLYYPWPEEDTITLRGVWQFLSYKQQQQILDFCGGPRG